MLDAARRSCGGAPAAPGSADADTVTGERAHREQGERRDGEERASYERGGHPATLTRRCPTCPTRHSARSNRLCGRRRP